MKNWQPPTEQQASGFRVPPQAIEVEKHVIGAVLAEAVNGGQLIDSAAALARLQVEDMYLERHQVIWSAMRDMHIAGQPIDLLTLRARLDQEKRLYTAGGEAYLMEITSEVVSSANVEHHAELVKEVSLRRKLIAGSLGVMEEAYAGNKGGAEILGMVESLALTLAEEKFSQGFQVYGQIQAEALKEIALIAEGKMTGCPTGFTDLDKITGGWQPTDFIVLAARPGMGKTALALSMLWRIAHFHKKRVGMISLEMGKNQLVQRILCAKRGINLHHLRTGKLSKEDLQNLALTAGELVHMPLHIDDKSVKTPLEILSQAKRLKLQHGLDLLVIDYLQLEKPDVPAENQNKELEIISAGCKALAKDLHIPVIALAQLSRDVEKRVTNHVPMLSDLRGSGGIEQAADIVGFIYRPIVYDPKAEPGLAEIHWAKYRNGPAGEVSPLTFHKESASFSDYVQPTLLEGAPIANRNAFAGSHKTSSAPPPRHPSDPGPSMPPRYQPRPGEANFD